MPFKRPSLSRHWLLLAVAVLLSACDLLGLGPDPRIAQREADAKAIGAACRNGLRGIEDCYALNKGVNKAAIYAGWLEMDAYMRENKLEGQRAEIAPPGAAPAAPAEEVVEEAEPKAKAAAR
ncbi:hypothetical protein LHU53_05900 [Rhodoferax sp. U2-2l]|uniref:hypothetical protein n=1 Tax=Rhodoferax sp. U2-2l TaxID=2884000 RepID=UPI001D0B4867|nr:hypothetical protein [Rhodoferax sp. U2-2l]MCB8746435.1 hypothetical protein [Rhodoferax sp. U2-2l]